MSNVTNVIDQLDQTALAFLVDRLAMIKATIAREQEAEKQIKQRLIESGYTAIDGTLHRAAISLCDGRKSIDWESIAYRLGEPSRQLIAAHTRAGDPFYVIRVSARKGVK